MDVGHLGELGVVVLASDGSVASANERACELLNVPSVAVLPERLAALRRLPSGGSLDSENEALIDTPEVGPLRIRSVRVGEGGEGLVLLIQGGRSLAADHAIMRQASHQRNRGFLARDWMHDLKGMLHVIKINHALMIRVLQRDPGNPLGAKSLDAIPREVERLDHALELILSVKRDDEPSTFDLGALCEQLVQIIGARASRQRVEVVLELDNQAKTIDGFEGQMQVALLNVLVNALEAMPEQGRLLIDVTGGECVTVRVCDTGPGMHEVPERGGPHFVNEPDRTAIGLNVTRTVVEAHGGRIECSANAPVGARLVIELPGARTGRAGHGPRTHRR